MKTKNSLSILICSIEERKEVLNELLLNLKKQINDTGNKSNVEILLEIDGGEKSIGSKRQSLLDRARGEYIVFIDDDDRISNFYVEKILKAVNKKPDCIGFRGRFKNWLFTNSLSIQEKMFDGKQHFSHICHINPIKKYIAAKFKFEDRFFEEDKIWLNSVLNSKLLKTEVFINEEMYFYTPSGEDEKKVRKDAMARKL